VIIGHSADYFLQENEKALHVFIYADRQARIERVMRRNDLNEHEAVTRIKKIDRNRASFYEQYTERKWGRSDNYHVCASSSFFGIEELAELIVHIARTT
jgi:cytidylate kinase